MKIAVFSIILALAILAAGFWFLSKMSADYGAKVEAQRAAKTSAAEQAR